MPRETFLDRLIGKLDALDSNSIQTYILRLAKEKNFLETVFNAIREGIVVIDRKLRIRYFNKASQVLLGLPDDVSKIRISQFLRDIDWKRILQEDEDEWYKLSRKEIEILYPARRILQFYLVPHQDNGGNATVILNDVTREREETLNEIEMKKVHLISLLAAGVAHEIGNPLNSLSLHLQLLRRNLGSGDFNKDEAAELVKTAESEVDRLDTIIRNFLNAVRPQKPEMSIIDIKSVLIDILNFMQNEIEGRSIEVKCEWPDNVPGISADHSQLKQAFYNIIKNAVQAMPGGGSLEVSVSYDDDWVRVLFADTGHGISPDEISSIFEPYYTTKEYGNGLGLVIVERIIREHGGELSVESRPGEGAVFTLSFPRFGKRMRVLPAPKDEELIDAEAQGTSEPEQMNLL